MHCKGGEIRVELKLNCPATALTVTTMSLDRQLEELQLLQCSLLPGELLIFLEEADTWNGLLTAYPDAVKVSHVSEPSFQIKIDQAQVYFDVVLPRSYLDAGAGPLVSVRGDIARAEQERWQKIIKEKLDELKGSEYVYSIALCQSL